MLTLFAARRGERPAALEYIAMTRRNQRAFNHYHHAQYACAYAALGDVSSGIDWARAAARNGFPCVDFMRRDTLLDPLRADSGFGRFLDELAEKATYALLYDELGLGAMLPARTATSA